MASEVQIKIPAFVLQQPDTFFTVKYKFYYNSVSTCKKVTRFSYAHHTPLYYKSVPSQQPSMKADPQNLNYT